MRCIDPRHAASNRHNASDRAPDAQAVDSEVFGGGWGNRHGLFCVVARLEVEQRIKIELSLT
ncbi:MAG: hypothetical protein L0G46_09115 [Kocuria sp.]|nr:hypothetical protein [Kocuria sp.]